MTSAKKYHCCIPGCTTYDTLGMFVPLPYENHKREQWLSNIPRKDWVVDSSTIACKKHFQKPVQICTKAIKDNTEKRSFTFVSTNSVPTLLLNPNRSLEINNEFFKCCYPQIMFELYQRDIEVPQSWADLETPNSDYLGTYYCLKMMYPKRLRILLQNTWKVVTSTDDIIFYTTDFSEIPRIICSVKVDTYLRVDVTLAGRIMDPLDLTWILPVSRRLNRWSQLRMILSVFGK